MVVRWFCGMYDDGAKMVVLRSDVGIWYTNKMVLDGSTMVLVGVVMVVMVVVRRVLLAIPLQQLLRKEIMVVTVGMYLASFRVVEVVGLVLLVEILMFLFPALTVAVTVGMVLRHQFLVVP